MVIKIAKKFKLGNVIKDFARMKNLKLSRLTPKKFFDLDKELYQSEIKKDIDFIRGVSSCMGPADFYHKNGFVLLGRDKNIQVSYLGQMRGENQWQGPTTDPGSKIVYSPSEIAIVEDTNKRIDITANPFHATYRLRDKDLERIIIKDKNYPHGREIVSYEGGYQVSKRENLREIRALLSRLF